MELALLLDVVVANSVIVIDLLSLVTEPFRFGGKTILFLDDAFDVNDLGLFGDVVQCEGLSSSSLMKICPTTASSKSCSVVTRGSSVLCGSYYSSVVDAV